MRHRPERKQGFTLVELLVSVVILGIGLIALAQLYTTAMWTYQKARYLSIATQRVQYEYERAQNFQYTVMHNSANLIGDSRYPASAGYRELATNDGVEFDMDNLPGGIGRIIVSEYQGHPSLLQVVIRIDWQEPRRTVSPVKVVTLLAK